MPAAKVFSRKKHHGSSSASFGTGGTDVVDPAGSADGNAGAPDLRGHI